MTQIAHPSTGVVTYSCDGAGKRVGKTLPNGTKTAYTHDDAGHPLSIEHRKADDSPLMMIAYTVDAVGDRLSITNNQGVHNYTYDAIYQLVGATHPNPVVNPNETYTYDPVGNRLTSHISASYVYDNCNRLLEDLDSHKFWPPASPSEAGVRLE